LIRVLLVDDEPQLLELARFFLEKQGQFAIETATSANEALNRISAGSLDAVVSDYQMSEMDGIELLKTLRAQKNDIPFILFTGRGREDVAIEALNSGASFYLQKGGAPKSQFAELANMIRSSVEKLHDRQELMESERRFRNMLANIHHAALVLDKESNITYCNDHLLRIVGYETHELMGRNAVEIFLSPEKRDEFREEQRRVMELGMYPAGSQYETLLNTKNGGKVLISWDSTALRDRDGNPIGTASIGDDITQKRKAEEELRRSESQYRRLVVTAPNLICTLSPSGETIFVNDYVEALSGYQPSELIGKNWWDVFYPGDLRSQVDSLMLRFEEGEVEDFEMTLMAKDGETRTVVWNSFNLWSEDGTQLIEINGAGLDVTARKRAEDALRESGAFNRAVLDSLDANIAVLDSRGDIVAVNRSWWMFARQNKGDTGSVGVGANYLDECEKASNDVRDARAILKGIVSVLGGEKESFSVEYSGDVNGEERWFSAQVTSLQRKRGGAVVSHIDVTKCKLAQKELTQSEERYRTIFETVGDSLIIADNDSIVILVNSEFERISGYQKSDIEGKMNLADFFAERDVKKLIDIGKKKMDDPASAIQSYEFRSKDKFGNEKAFIATASTLPTAERMVISLVDQTERRYYEDALEQVRRKIDILAKITRHDILNQLSVLYGYLELAREQARDEKLSGTLQKLYLATNSIKHHLEFARDYQNMGAKRPQWVDVRASCKKAASNMDTKNVSVVIELRDLEVFADPMLEKVFYNLIDNSIRHGGVVRKIKFSFVRDRDGMRIICQDDGMGIPVEQKTSIFKRDSAMDGEQRGYGLYLAKEILGITGMTISENGTAGECAMFVIHIPPGKYRTKPQLRKRKSQHSSY